MGDRSHRLSAAGSGESCAWELHECTSGRPAVEGVLAPPHVDGGRRRLAVADPLVLLLPPPHVRAAQSPWKNWVHVPCVPNLWHASRSRKPAQQRGLATLQRSCCDWCPTLQIQALRLIRDEHFAKSVRRYMVIHFDPTVPSAAGDGQQGARGAGRAPGHLRQRRSARLGGIRIAERHVQRRMLLQ